MTIVTSIDYCYIDYVVRTTEADEGRGKGEKVEQLGSI
jgi:hypothetical protein